MGLFTQEAKTDYSVPLFARLAAKNKQSQRQFTDQYLDPFIKENIGYESPRMKMKSIAQGVDLSDGKAVQKAYMEIQAINPQEAQGWLESIKPVIALQLESLKLKSKTIKGADGYNYYIDTGERVLKDVVKAPDNDKDQKKWDFEQRSKRDAIRREAESRNYTLTESEINDIAIATPLSANLNHNTGLMIHPWMDLLIAKLNTKEQNKGSNTGASTPTPSAVSTAAAPAADIADLQAMNTQFGVETKDLKENISTVEAGLMIVNQVRGGNTSSMPQLERMLAKFNSDNRISVPEVKQVMKIGGLGERITDSITRFLSGELSPGTLNDIEEMLTRMGQLDQKNYNSKVSNYKSRYSKRFGQDTLSQWLKPSDKKFFTQEQRRELYEQEMKKRGLK